MLRIEVSCRTFLHKQFIKNIFMKRLKNITFYNLCIIIYLYQVSDQSDHVLAERDVLTIFQIIMISPEWLKQFLLTALQKKGD